MVSVQQLSFLLVAGRQDARTATTDDGPKTAAAAAGVSTN